MPIHPPACVSSLPPVLRNPWRFMWLWLGEYLPVPHITHPPTSAHHVRSLRSPTPLARSAVPPSDLTYAETSALAWTWPRPPTTPKRGSCGAGLLALVSMHCCALRCVMLWSTEGAMFNATATAGTGCASYRLGAQRRGTRVRSQC